MPLMVPPGVIGIASFETPAGTLNVLKLVGDTESVTVDGAVVITTAQTASWSYGKVQLIGRSDCRMTALTMSKFVGFETGSELSAVTECGRDHITILSFSIAGYCPVLKAVE